MKRALIGLAAAGMFALVLAATPQTAAAQAPASTTLCPGGEPERTVTSEQSSVVLTPGIRYFNPVFVPGTVVVAGTTVVPNTVITPGGVIVPGVTIGAVAPVYTTFASQVVTERVTTTYNYKGVTGVTFIVRENSLLGRQEILSTPAWLRAVLGQDERAIRQALEAGTLKNAGPCS